MKPEQIGLKNGFYNTIKGLNEYFVYVTSIGRDKNVTTIRYSYVDMKTETIHNTEYIGDYNSPPEKYGLKPIPNMYVESTKEQLWKILNKKRNQAYQIYTAHTAQSMKWKIKRQSNDELRQKFVDQTVAQAEFAGLTIPDPALTWNETSGHYDFGEIDWDEFDRVVAGNGMCNRQRLAHHLKAHEEGEWVREAMHAHEQKKHARGARDAA